MGKSLGNFITLDQFFTGDHPSLEQAYSPMTIRFFILMAHYRSTVDFSNEALKSAEKGLNRLMEAYQNISKITVSENSTVEIRPLKEKMFAAMSDDLNSPIVLSHLFECVTIINKIIAGTEKIDQNELNLLQETMQLFIFDILGLRLENISTSENNEVLDEVMQLVIEMRKQAKSNKDWTTADLIRNKLTEIGIEIKDTKEGSEWKVNK